ncbi:cache domain-containing protein, partial [Rhodoferax sp.]|uniref:cache domain-containing protein n=1 Tax=Rhodoferax sp. TaxID=50421 RepID=UPI00374D7C3B
LTLALGAFFSWQSVLDQRASFKRVESASVDQQKARLMAEMDSAISYLEFTRARTEDVLRKSLTEHVDTAMQIAEAIYAKESPRRPAAEVKQLIVEALRPVRFYEGRGYYFIDDLKGQFILLPTAPQREGNTVLDNQDDTGHFIMRGLIDAAQKPRGEGFSRYRWYTPENPKQMGDKLAYVRHFKPYGWLIGTGDYTANWEQLQKQEVITRLRSLRFGASGYIGLLDRDGRLILSAPASGIEGMLAKDMHPIQRAGIDQLTQIAKSGGGFTHYEWTDPKTGQTVGKTAFVRVAEPWGWTLVATIFDDELQTALKLELAQHEPGSSNNVSQLLLALAVALTVGLGASYLFSLWSRKLFKRYHDEKEASSRALLESQALYRLIADNSSDVIWLMALPGKQLTYISPAIARLLGWTAEEVMAQPLDASLTVESARRMDAVLVDSFNRLAAGDDAARFFTIELDQPCKDGRIISTELVATMLLDEAGQPRQVLGITRDITERKQVQADLMLAASVFTHAREGIMITTLDGDIIDVNDAFTRITGYLREEVVGKNPRLLKSGRQSNAYYAAMWGDLMHKGHWHGEVWNQRKCGEVYPQMQTISAVCDAQGNKLRFVALFSDITSIKVHQNELEQIAHFDALTRLPNRVLLADRLRQGLSQALRRGQLLAVAYLDLDGFKGINDTHGHDVGDHLLVVLADRMKQVLREGDTLARIGGDEFVAVLVDLDDMADCVPMLNRLLAAAAQPVQAG